LTKKPLFAALSLGNFDFRHYRMRSRLQPTFARSTISSPALGRCWWITAAC